MTEHQVPFSEAFQDVYFSRENGLAESEHVFLGGNDLSSRWRSNDVLTICETGFGTGLNFLATWRAWRREAPSSNRLHYLSVEKYPLSREALADAHGLFPELKELSQTLLYQLAEPLSGFHRYHFEGQQVCLTLCHGDAVDMLRQLVADVDCWFLDGFAPSRNPEMWSEGVFREIARLSRVGTSFATFTVAGVVRRGLASQGFRVVKQPGFGTKREMCAGTMATMPAFRPREPWFRRPVIKTKEKSALIIGAGIAGAQAAYGLAERGWQVDVLERNPDPGREASGNPAAVISPFVSARSSLEDQFSIQSFRFTLRQLDRLDPQQRFHHRCGVLALSCSEESRTQAERIAARELPPDLVNAVNAEDARALSRLPTTQAGLFYPQAGWISPTEWIQTLLHHSGIRLHRQADVASIDQRGDQWVALDAAGVTLSSATIVILAAGQSMDWSQCRWIPTTPVAGQTTYLDAAQVNGSPTCVVRYGGYLVPLNETSFLLGSTYRRGDSDNALDSNNDRINWDTLSKDLPEAAGRSALPAEALRSAHAAVRMTSENRLPIVGALPDPGVLTDQYPAMLRRGYEPGAEDPVYPPGLYLSAAWGSRGMTNAALGGELLACLINHEPLPLQASIVHALHPARSLVRQLKQGKR